MRLIAALERALVGLEPLSSCSNGRSTSSPQLLERRLEALGVRDQVTFAASPSTALGVRAAAALREQHQASSSATSATPPAASATTPTVEVRSSGTRGRITRRSAAPASRLARRAALFRERDLVGRRVVVLVPSPGTGATSTVTLLTPLGVGLLGDRDADRLRLAGRDARDRLVDVDLLAVR